MMKFLLTYSQFSFSVPSESNTSCTSLLMSDLLCHLLSLITNTSLCLDLVAHQHVLQLAGNLLCGKHLCPVLKFCNFYLKNVTL